MMICSGLAIFIAGALCSLACIAALPAVYKNGRKKEMQLFAEIEREQR